MSEQITEPPNLLETISDGTATIESVLLHKSLFAGLTREQDVLLDFILNTNNFRKLLKYAFSVAFMQEENFFNISEKAAAVLMYNCIPILDKVTEDEGFSHFLLQFFDTEAADITLFAIHFMKILKTYMNYTSGSILTNLQDLFPLLIKKITIFPYAELLENILIHFDSFIDDKDLLFGQLAQAIKYKESYAMATIFIISSYIKKLIDDNPEDPFEDLDLSPIVTALFVCVQKHESVAVKIQALQLIKRFKKSSNNYNDIITEHEEDFDFQLSPILPELLAIYPNQAIKSYKLLFENPYNTFLCNNLVRSIIISDISEINKLIEETNIIDLIYDVLHEERPNAHVFRLARFFKTKQAQLPALDSEKWKELENIIVLKCGFISDSYGGSLATFDVNADLLAIERNLKPGQVYKSVVNMFNFNSSDEDSDDGKEFNPFD